MADPIDTVLARAARLTADGRPVAAIELLRPVLASNPGHSAAWCRLSAAYLDAGEVTGSLDAAKRAITLGERSWAHRLASLALVELGRNDEAVASAREAVRRDPVDWRCHVALAESLAPDSPDEALKVALTAVDLAPREPRPHEVVGDIAVRLEDVALARRAYTDALRLDPDNVHVLASLGRLGSTAKAPPPPAVAPAPRPPVQLGRAHRIVLWLVLRRIAVWLAIGSFVLLLAGLPSPSPLLVWFGFGLLLFGIGLAGRGWLTLPPDARTGIQALTRSQPLVAVSALLLCASLLALAAWVVAVALGARGLQLLGIALACSVMSAALGSVCLWRLKVRTR